MFEKILKMSDLCNLRRAKGQEKLQQQCLVQINSQHVKFIKWRQFHNRKRKRTIVGV